MQYLESLVIVLIISLPAFFFWQWLYNKFIKNKRKNLIATWGSTFLLTPLIYAAAVYSLLFWWSYYPNRNFEKQRWIEQPEKRYEMSKNIMESRMLVGKTREQVTAMLGKNDSFDGIDIWYFYMGMPPGFSIDGDVLHVEFENNRVSKANVFEH